MQTHYKYIDRLKGFAILSVIMGHFLIFVLNKMGIVFEVIGSYHMPLFMFLSGLVANVKSAKKASTKIIQFMMPTIMIGSLYIYVWGISYSEFLGSPYKGGYWYLYVLSLFYILLLVINKMSKGLGGAFLAFLIYGIFYILNLLIAKEWNDFFSIWIMKQYWPFFICGHLITRFSLSQKLFTSDIAYTVALILYLVSFTIWYSGMASLYYLVSFSFILFVSCFMMMRENTTSFIERQLEYFGNKTLDIYIFHFFFIQMTHLTALGHWLECSNNILLEIAMGSVYSIIIAYLSVGVGKIIRSSNVLRNIVYGDFAKRIIISNPKFSDNHL